MLIFSCSHKRQKPLLRTATQQRKSNHHRLSRTLETPLSPNRTAPEKERRPGAKATEAAQETRLLRKAGNVALSRWYLGSFKAALSSTVTRCLSLPVRCSCQVTQWSHQVELQRRKLQTTGLALATAPRGLRLQLCQRRLLSGLEIATALQRSLTVALLLLFKSRAIISQHQTRPQHIAEAAVSGAAGSAGNAKEGNGLKHVGIFRAPCCGCRSAALQTGESLPIYQL